MAIMAPKGECSAVNQMTAIHNPTILIICFTSYLFMSQAKKKMMPKRSPKQIAR